MISGIDIEDMKPERVATNHIGWEVQRYSDEQNGWETYQTSFLSKQLAMKACLQYSAWWPHIEFRVYEKLT